MNQHPTYDRFSLAAIHHAIQAAAGDEALTRALFTVAIGHRRSGDSALFAQAAEAQATHDRSLGRDPALALGRAAAHRRDETTHGEPMRVHLAAAIRAVGGDVNQASHSVAAAVGSRLQTPESIATFVETFVESNANMFDCLT